ncbi:hypothetical protein, partial [Ochrobactrum sp. S1502_03]|uniref:hypothetical protein n=1 Tax=Ochrobactrum sp. S1502_03 TaxID=3108451 RepID=UPI0037C6CFC6
LLPKRGSTSQTYASSRGASQEPDIVKFIMIQALNDCRFLIREQYILVILTVKNDTAVSCEAWMVIIPECDAHYISLFQHL